MKALSPQLQRKVGLSAERVAQLLRTPWVPRVGDSAALPAKENRRYTEEVRAAARKLFAAGRAKAQIARELNIPRGSLYYILFEKP